MTWEEAGNALLTDTVIDQTALHGLLKKVCNLEMPLLSINSVGLSPQEKSHDKQVTHGYPQSLPDWRRY